MYIHRHLVNFKEIYAKKNGIKRLQNHLALMLNIFDSNFFQAKTKNNLEF